ncbi:MAG: right-handed parallel beta-helix repeat-containing protein [Bdellovibrionia bacterium]
MGKLKSVSTASFAAIFAMVSLSACELVQPSTSIKLSQTSPSGSPSDPGTGSGNGSGSGNGGGGGSGSGGGGGGGGTTLSSYSFPDLPVAPTPSGHVLTVGSGKMYASPCAAIAAAANNDTIQIDAGTYVETCYISKNGLTIRGPATTGSPTVIMDSHTVRPAGCKGIFVVSGNDTVIENIAFTGATLNPGDPWVANSSCSADMNGAGIRMEGTNITIRNCSFTLNDDGILAGVNTASSFLIENSYFSQNSSDSYSHNLYIGEVANLTFRYNYSTNTRHDGHLLKSRAQHNYIYNNRLTGEAGFDSYEINLPNAGESYVIGNIIQQTSNTGNSGIIDFGSEGYTAGHDTHLYVVNNTILNDRGSGNIVQVANGGTAVIKNNAIVGGGTLINNMANLASQASNYVGNSPMFTDKANFNLKPLAGSPLIHTAADPGIVNNYSLLPVNEYVHQQSAKSRNNTSGLDIGAISSN